MSLIDEFSLGASSPVKHYTMKHYYPTLGNPTYPTPLPKLRQGAKVKFGNNSEIYVLACVGFFPGLQGGNAYYGFIGVTSGNRWREPVKRAPFKDVTEGFSDKEIAEMIGTYAAEHPDRVTVISAS